LSEDWSFCRLARGGGWKVYADCKPRLKHTGPYPFRTIDSLSLPPEDDIVEIQEHNPIIAKKEKTSVTYRAIEGLSE
jgi:hypothetical protein